MISANGCNENELYDKTLLELCQDYWRSSNWDALSSFDFSKLIYHPKRAQIALLVAVSMLQKGDVENFSRFLQQAQEWGEAKNNIVRMLFSSSYITLARIRAINFQGNISVEYLQKSAIFSESINNSVIIDYPENSNKDNSKQRDFNSEGMQVVDKHNSKNALYQYWKLSIQHPLEYKNADETRSIRLVELFNKYIKKNRILELGVNCGRNLFHLYKSGFHDLEGIEISSVAISTLRNSYKELDDVEIHNGAIEDFIINYPDRHFECVYTMAVLEHIHKDSEWIFEHMARISKFVITIEDELRSGERHFKRNYEDVFSKFQMKQIHSEGREKFNLPTGFVARVFCHESVFFNEVLC